MGFGIGIQSGFGRKYGTVNKDKSIIVCIG